MKCKLGALGVLFAAGLATAAPVAEAADMYQKYDPLVSAKDAPLPGIWSWAGLYVGANLGGALNGDGGTANLVRTTPPAGQIGTVSEQEAEGIFAGAQIGHNWQRNRIVFGIEADIQASDIDDSVSGSYNLNPGFVGGSSIEVDFFATIRARLGYAWDKYLIYATGGFAVADAQYRLVGTNTANGNTVALQDDDVRHGYVLGMGAEMAVNGEWTVKIEYQYLDFDEEFLSGQSFTPGGVPTGIFYKGESELDFHTVRVGVNRKF